MFGFMLVNQGFNICTHVLRLSSWTMANRNGLFVCTSLIPSLLYHCLFWGFDFWEDELGFSVLLYQIYMYWGILCLVRLKVECSGYITIIIHLCLVFLTCDSRDFYSCKTLLILHASWPSFYPWPVYMLFACQVRSSNTYSSNMVKEEVLQLVFWKGIQTCKSLVYQGKRLNLGYKHIIDLVYFMID